MEGPVGRDNVLVRLNSFLPFLNETSIQIGGLTHAQAADLSFQWEDNGDSLAYHTGADASHLPVDDGDHKTKAGQSVHIVTPYQQFGLPNPFASRTDRLFLLAWVISFTAIFSLMFWLAKLAVRRVFLLHVSDGLDVPKPAVVDTCQNLFIVRDLPVGSSNGIAGAQQFFPIDLAIDTLEEGWVERIETRLRTRTPADKVVIHHFEYGT